MFNLRSNSKLVLDISNSLFNCVINSFFFSISDFKDFIKSDKINLSESNFCCNSLISEIFIFLENL